ncbi:uncharacterized protein N7529_004723 [Penicillium soppii]|uniref:uncharacterized protein n=1 Tax=Penicillium soppii TaxID=69789 RepID=UPI002548448D|nr:uncharacterized protein N7529_004723 [Penicillium soppii]KAJ5872370.1 hypothetical protein N7529_004723 [Penicillium soppii]
MGRWGWRLFESDQDLDTVCSLVEELGFETDSWEFTLSSMVYHTDMLAPTESRALYETPEYSNHLANTIVPYLRNKLDIPCKNGTSLQLGWLTTIESEYSITAAQFNTWNPYVGSDCAGLWLNFYVCVGVQKGITTAHGIGTSGVDIRDFWHLWLST